MAPVTPLRVLLVEDDDENRIITARVLGAGGFAVTEAASAGEALAAFGQGFDVVVLDLSLPDLDGWAVARRMKQQSPRTPIALLTGWGLGVGREEARRRGVDELFGKPVPPPALARRLAELVAESAAAAR